MLGHVLMDSTTLEEVHMKFLEAGHTNMPCDTVHSVIERAAKSKRLYVPNDWVNVIQGSCSDSPYLVHQMYHYSFLDYKQLKDRVGIFFSLSHL